MPGRRDATLERRIEELMEHPEWLNESQRSIAAHLGCSRGPIARTLRKLRTSGRLSKRSRDDGGELATRGGYILRTDGTTVRESDALLREIQRLRAENRRLRQRLRDAQSPV